MSLTNWKIQSMKSQIAKWQGIADTFLCDGNREMYQKADTIANEIHKLIQNGKGFEDSGNTFVKTFKY